MTIKVKAGKLTTTEAKKLDGKTLKAIVTECKRSGLKDQNGKRRFAVHNTTVKTDLGLTHNVSQIEILTKVKAAAYKKKIKFALVNVTVTVTGDIFYCVPKHLRRLSKPAQTEWGRFYGALIRHETRHYMNGIKAAESLARHLRKLKVELVIDYFDPFSQDSVEKAKTEAAKKLGKVSVTVSDSSVALLALIDDNVDVDTGHGATEGAVLDASIR